MLKITLLLAIICGAVIGETSVNGIRASNVLGGSEQHASFSFVRPGLTQTSYAFNGPSSHQSFSSSIGNPHLAQRVLPNVANALAYRNPGLGYFAAGPISTGYANAPHAVNSAGNSLHSSPHSPISPIYSYQQQAPLDQATALAYLQQYQQQYQPHGQIENLQNSPVQQTYNSEIANGYQTQLGQILALRQQQALLQFQAQANAQHQQQSHGHQRQTPEHIPVHETSQETSEQAQLQQQEQQPAQNLLGVAYSSAPSVAHVKVSGNGYKFNF